MEKKYQFINIENKDSCFVITFNRPDVFNSMNRQTKLEIISAIKEGNKNEKVAAIILTGEGKAFSSGQDLSDPSVQPHKGKVDLGYTLQTEWNPLVESIYQSEKLVIAAINGVCAGAGLSVALTCDLKIARPQCKFVSGFVQIGLIPDAGSSFLLTRHLGHSKALEFALTNKGLLAEDLEKAGLINEINEKPLERALSLGMELGKLPPLALKMLKANFRFAQENTWAQVVEKETYCQRFLGNSQDYLEGVMAFLEKRPAKFLGK